MIVSGGIRAAGSFHNGFTMTAFLEFNGISKSYPGVQALSNISFSVVKGAVHGLMGENGAGKIDADPRPFRRSVRGCGHDRH